jgi:hypothetical protein
MSSCMQGCRGYTPPHLGDFGSLPVGARYASLQVVAAQPQCRKVRKQVAKALGGMWLCLLDDEPRLALLLQHTGPETWVQLRNTPRLAISISRLNSAPSRWHFVDTFSSKGEAETEPQSPLHPVEPSSCSILTPAASSPAASSHDPTVRLTGFAA